MSKHCFNADAFAAWSFRCGALRGLGASASSAEVYRRDSAGTDSTMRRSIATTSTAMRRAAAGTDETLRRGTA